MGRWERRMSLVNFLWGLWNGICAWPILIVHALGGWARFHVYNVMRDSAWYQFGFLIGAGSPFLGLFGRRRRRGSSS